MKNCIFNTKELIIPFLLSVVFHYIIFWNEILRRFGSYTNGFIVAFLISLFVVLFFLYKKNENINVGKFLAISILTPYIISVFGYFGVIIHGVAIHNKFSGSLSGLLFPVFLFAYAAIKGWFITLYLLILEILKKLLLSSKSQKL